MIRMISSGADDDQFEPRPEDILGGGGDFEARPMPSGSDANRTGDWQIEDFQSQSNRPSNSTTTSGDWSLEEVESKQKQNDQFKFSNPQPAQDSGGDWAIEETNVDKDK